MSASDEHLLLIDASLRHRLALELRNRGRASLALKDLGAERLTDPALLRFVTTYWPEVTVVTADDHMPEEHSELFDRWSPTVAIIDPLRPFTFTEIEWHQEIVHRWAHSMQTQDRSTVRRYAAKGGRAWTRPRRTKPTSAPAAVSPPTISTVTTVPSPTVGPGPVDPDQLELFLESD